MTEYLIVYLYADGVIETNEAYKEKRGDCLNLEDLLMKGWRIMNIGVLAYSPMRNLGWCMCVMEKKG